MKHLFLLLLSCAAFGQQIKNVDFKSVDGRVSVDPIQQTVSGSATYAFDVLAKIDTIKIDAINMQFSKVMINGKPVNSKTISKALLLFQGFKKGKNTVSFDYSATPKQTLYFTGTSEKPQFWTQGQGKYTSHWFPSFDDTNEKVIFNMSIRQKSNLTVISNGMLENTKLDGDKKQWNFTMKEPMSSYLLMLAAGDFAVQNIKTNSGITIESYIEREDFGKWEPTYRHSREIFDFLNEEIGVDYPWEIYKQVPVRDFLYAGMENTSATVFARDYVVDEIGYNDRNYLNVNAHELAHQWFGDMVTATSGEHHWLQEGFATYYALLAERSVFGDDYFYRKMYDMAENLQRAEKTDTIPLLNAKASSLTFYQKGAWALHVLRVAVGEAPFRLAVKNYLVKYKFKNVTTEDFLNEIKLVSDYDVALFRKRWLESPGFEIGEALALISKSELMTDYFAIAGMADKSYGIKQQIFEDVMRSDAHFTIKEEIIFQTQEVPFAEKQQLIRLALATNEIKVRQMVAKTLREFPVDFESEFETLLDDKSYITQEITLNVLWSQFPERQAVVLDKTNGRIGMNDKNLRILWLTLALATPNYQSQNKAKFYDELLDYASPAYESSVRMNAIESLLYIDKTDRNVLAHLVNATTHHKWQFTLFAREKIRSLLNGKSHRIYFEEMLPKLTENEKFQLARLLKE